MRNFINNNCVGYSNPAGYKPSIIRSHDRIMLDLLSSLASGYVRSRHVNFLEPESSHSGIPTVRNADMQLHYTFQGTIIK